MDYVVPWSKQWSGEAGDEAFHFQHCFRACQIKRFFFDFVCSQRCNICKVVSSICKLVFTWIFIVMQVHPCSHLITIHNSHLVSFSLFRHPRCHHHCTIHLHQPIPPYQFQIHLQWTILGDWFVPGAVSIPLMGQLNTAPHQWSLRMPAWRIDPFLFRN